MQLLSAATAMQLSCTHRHTHTPADTLKFHLYKLQVKEQLGELIGAFNSPQIFINDFRIAGYAELRQLVSL